MADLSQYDPNDIRNIVNEILSRLRALEQGFIDANALDEIAGELGDVPISITDDDGNLVFLISQVNLFEEYGVDTYVSFFAADGTPTVWVDPVTGLLTDASGTVVSGDVISDVTSSTVGNIVVMSNTDGKHIQDSGLSIISDVDGNIGIGSNVLSTIGSGADVNTGLGNGVLTTVGSGSDNNIGIGEAVLVTVGSGSSNNTGIGETVLETIGDNCDENIVIGHNAFPSLGNNISNNIGIGNRVGQYETGSNKLFIGNDSTSTDEATGRQATLLYGDMVAGELTINGDLIVTGSITGSGSGLTHPQIMARVSLGF